MEDWAPALPRISQRSRSLAVPVSLPSLQDLAQSKSERMAEVEVTYRQRIAEMSRQANDAISRKGLRSSYVSARFRAEYNEERSKATRKISEIARAGERPEDPEPQVRVTGFDLPSSSRS